ncbi:MAG TPA: type IV toxin-antitoxin system AbiEi family antitoxin domain-containing protein [Gemmatimonadaceae bacterium]|jgi:predicted transcriptional regulator of viral defense system|nr:type IV toxin-antitoxin system AbiEi family antitoxin domain-containing protein [Gemmatimonadaceae bacterium]
MPTFRDNPTSKQRGAERVMELARQRRILRPKDLEPYGLDPILLRRLQAAGRLERRARGIYVPSDGNFSEQQMLAETTIRIPHGVVCLLSALRFHDLTTQNPTEIWLAIDHHARTPRVPEIPLRIVRFSGAALTAGVAVHKIDGTPVRVYDAAKTVADCFKFRNKIGVDIAIEALRDYLRRRNRKIDALWRYAAIDRVQTVIRPYLEAAA